MGGDRDEHLDGLRWHWGSAYLIAHPGPDTWVAWRRDDQARLHAEDPVQLRDKIVADYAARPVPRDLPGRPRGARGPGSRFTIGG